MSKFIFDEYDAFINMDWYEYEQDSIEFEGCCGADILFNFPLPPKDIIKELEKEWTDQYEYSRKYDDCDITKKPNKQYFKNLMKKEVNRVLSMIDKSNRLQFIILIECQKKVFGKGLIENGFRLVSDRNVNKKTGNRLYVYLRDPATPKGVKKIRRTFR